MIFGMGDYAASQGLVMENIGLSEGYPGDIFHYPRYHMTIAARAAGLDAVDGPFVDFKNDDVYRIECQRALTLGMVGKWAIHPSQIEPALEVFSPSQKMLILLARSSRFTRKPPPKDLAQSGIRA